MQMLQSLKHWQFWGKQFNQHLGRWEQAVQAGRGGMPMKEGSGMLLG